LNFEDSFQKSVLRVNASVQRRKLPESGDADRWRPENYDVVFELPDLSGLRSLALHESAHGSVAAAYGLHVAAVEIDGLDGFTFVPNIELARPNVRLAVYMAGDAGEREFLGREMAQRPLDNSDQHRIADVLLRIDRKQWPFVLAQARGSAARAVQTHRGTILKVANALLERCAVAGEPRGRLDGDALADLLGGPTAAILRAAMRPTEAGQSR
jgi:hypothetical protein